MGPDLTLEVIYFEQTTDFKMEFELCGCCNIRFLSHLTSNKSEFLNVLSKSVVRSRVVVAVGSFNPLTSDYIPKIIAKAAGYVLKPIDKEKFAIVSKMEYFLPDTAIPLISEAGMLGGCVLENNDQAIIMLTGERKLRQELVSQLVCPYLKIFAGKKRGIENSTSSVDVSQESISDENSLATDSKNTTEEILPDNNTVSHKSSELKEELSDESYLSEKSASNSKVESTVTYSDNNNLAESVAVMEKDDLKQEEETSFVVLEQPEASKSVRYNLEDFLSFNEAPEKRRRGHALRAVISVILVGAVLISAYFGYEWVYQPMHYKSVLNSAQEMYGQTWSELPVNILYKFGKLYKANSDVIGWLSIPNTEVNLPIVSSAKKSSGYYRSHLFEGSVNKYGTPYTNSYIDQDTYSRNIVIYGKGDNNVSVFSDIKKFLENEQYISAPVFSFDTIYMENRWKIFSVYVSSSDDIYDDIETNFFDDESFLEYALKIKERSRIDTNINITSTDELLTLVCEDEKSNIVMVARKVRNGEATLVDFDNSEEETTESLVSSSVVSSSPLTEIDPPSSSSSSVSSSSKVNYNNDKNVADNGSSRYEQQGLVSSSLDIKPTVPTVSKEQSSSVSSNSSTVSSAGSNTSAVNSSISSNNVSSQNTSSSSTSSVNNAIVNLPILYVTNSFNGTKVSGQANEIIAQIIEAEMGSGYNIEALKAQAVAAYSWLLCNGAASGAYPTAPLKTAGERAIMAADSVAGVVATYNGNVAQTFYYAISAGCTANSADIWSAQLPYLVSVDSSVDKNITGYQTIRKYSSSDVATWIKECTNGNIDLTKISNKSNWFKCNYDTNGLYVKTVEIGGITKKGTYLRDSVFTSKRVGSANVLRSSAYTIVYSESEDKFIFTVKGYGHGVGMSQVGANAYANSGWNYEQILKHYYKGISFGMYTK